MQSKNVSHLIMKSHNKMHQHQRKSYKMHIPDSEKYTYVKMHTKKKKHVHLLQIAQKTIDGIWLK